jgi:DNA-binding NtrC family response regulator
VGRRIESDDSAERTDTYPEEESTWDDGAELAIRWVFPFPLLAPTWLDQVETTIGRDASNSVELPSPYVSRVHACIARSGPFHVLSDVSTKNGVSLDGDGVGEGVLAEGSVLRIGDFVGVCVRAPLEEDLGCVSLRGGITGGYRHRQLVARVAQVAATSLPVILEGETGTGKEVFSRSVHELSGRTGPFLPYNCSLYSKTTGPAELFGYRRGAFTGAEQSSLGHVRAAEGGTLVLDEVLDLSLEIQATLLRVLENREVLPLGELRSLPINVRFLATTQSSLERAVVEGRFRADLRARLEGATLKLPSLRDCREIVPELFLSLFARHTGRTPELTAGFVEELCLRDWPLNIRELETLARRLATNFECGVKLSRSHLGDARRPPTSRPAAPPQSASFRSSPSVPSSVSTAPGGKSPYGTEDVQQLLQSLTRCGGNLTRAAAEIGVTRQKAYRMLRAARGD